ncbi:MAG: hypothetical protein MUF21_06200, partial [Gemmatimonadaceae bacterium]|nr:hypothetical protein [Gemmatimonadaceae bacterium]
MRRFPITVLFLATLTGCSEAVDPAGSASVVRLAVDPGTVTLQPFETTQLAVRALGAGDRPVTGAPVRWR